MADRFLTLDQVTAEAMTILPGVTSEDRIYAKQWAYNALRAIGPCKDNINTTVLYPDNLLFRKPDNCYKVIDIGVFNAGNSELRCKYYGGKKRVHQSRNVYINTGVYVEQFDSIIEISEDENFIYMSNTALSVGVAYAELRYYMFPVDEDGNPMFPEYTRIAIAMFIRWMWSMRTGEENTQIAEQRWRTEMMIAKGKQRLNPLEFKQIAKEWNSMIQKVNFDKF